MIILMKACCDFLVRRCHLAWQGLWNPNIRRHFSTNRQSPRSRKQAYYLSPVPTYICLYARPLPSLSGNRTHARTRTSPRGVCLSRLHKLITRAAHSEFSRAKNQRIIGSMRSPSQSCNLDHTPQVVYILAQRSKGAHGDRFPPYT